MRKTICGSAMILAAAMVCQGAATPPPPAIARNSPKAAIQSLVQAMSTGDAETMRDLLHAKTPEQRRLVGVMVDTAVAIAAMNRAMGDKFGAEQTKAVLGDPADQVRMTTEKLNKAQEQITDDTAKVTLDRTPQGTMSLKKIDGRWEVDVAAYIHGATPDQVQQILKAADHGIEVYRQAVADVNAGKFKTAKEAGETLRARLQPASKTPEPAAKK